MKYWEERTLGIIDTIKDAQLFSFFIEPEVTRGKFTLFANTTPGDSSCEPVRVKFHLRWRGFPIINPQDAAVNTERYYLMNKEHQYATNVTSHTDSSAPVKLKELILVNPLPGDWYASAYIDSKDDRIQQKGLVKTCITKLTVALSIKRLKMATGESKLSFVRVNHVTPLEIVDKSTNYFKFVLPASDSLRDKVTIKVTNCSLGESKFDKCPIKMYIRRYGLPCKDVYHGDYKTGANDDFIDCSLSMDCSFHSIDVAKVTEASNYGPSAANYLSIDFAGGNRGIVPTARSPFKLHLSINSIPYCTPITLTIPPSTVSPIAKATESTNTVPIDSTDFTSSSSNTDESIDLINSNGLPDTHAFPASSTASPQSPSPDVPALTTEDDEEEESVTRTLDDTTTVPSSSTLSSEVSSIETEVSTVSSEDVSATLVSVDDVTTMGSSGTQVDRLQVNNTPSDVLSTLMISDPYNSYHSVPLAYSSSYLSAPAESSSSSFVSPFASSSLSTSSIKYNEHETSTFCPVNVHLERHTDSMGTNLKFVTDSSSRIADDFIVSHSNASSNMHNESIISIPTSDLKTIRMTLLSFIMNPLIDSGNILTVELALSSAIDTSQHNVSAEACLSYERIPLDMTDCGKKIHVNTSSVPETDVLTKQFTYTRVPFASSGIYYLSLRVTCYVQSSDGHTDTLITTSVPCSHNESVVRISIKSSACDTMCTKNGGKCVRYFAPTAPHLTFSQCQCRNHLKGWSCEDNTDADTPDIVWRNFYLLIVSNVFLAPCALFALVKRCYVESLVYTVTMLSSAFYHACDTDSVPFCILNLHVLQFADFYGAILTVWVTLVSVASLGERVKAFFHMLGAIGIVYLVELDKESFLTFALPVAIGGIIVLLSWIVRCVKHSICYPSGLLWCCSVLPAFVFASLAICVYSLLETKDNYAITHSIWHVLASVALFFLLIAFPKRGRKKGCCSKRNTNEMAGSDTYYELITDEASHLARTHKYADSAPSTSTVLPP